MEQQISTILLTAMRKEPGHCKSFYCRTINGKEERYCYDKNCYGNSWKRARGICKISDCQFRKPTVWRKIKNLEISGLIKITREKVKDRWMSRGWDWMKVCRPIGGISQ